MQGSDIAWLFRWEPATHAAYGSALHHWRGHTCWWSPPWGFASRFQKACGLFNICFRQVHIMDPPLVDDIIILRVQSLANWCVSNSYQMLPALERILKLKPLANPASCPSTIILHLPNIQLSCWVMLPKLCPRFTTTPQWTILNHQVMSAQMNNKMIQGTSANSTCWANNWPTISWLEAFRRLGFSQDSDKTFARTYEYILDTCISDSGYRFKLDWIMAFKLNF